MSETIATEKQHGESSIEGKYLSFSLASQQYAVDILRVVEIFGMCEITRVPRCPDHVRGVINLRGKIIPVVDLRLKFGLQEKEYDSRTCIIVLNTISAGADVTVGIIVDTVLEVRDFQGDQIAPPPNYGAEMNTNFIVGMGRCEGNEVAILLDIDKVFAQKDSVSLHPNMSDGNPDGLENEETASES